MVDKTAETLITRLKGLKKTFALAESCTAGLAADMAARVPGASAVFWGSFVTYTLDAKERMLGLDRESLKKYGAVSRETACGMVRGALLGSGADMAAAVTGLAGPDGDGTGLPVGTVWIASALRGGEIRAELFNFAGDRQEIRLAAAERTLRELLSLLAAFEKDRE